MRPFGAQVEQVKAAYDKFLKTHGSGTKGRTVPEETIARYQELLPPIVLQLWRDHGWCSYDNGFLWLVDPDELRGPLREWLGADAERAQPFLRTGLGEVAFWLDSKVGLLDVESDRINEFGNADLFFWYPLCDDEYLDKAIGRKDFRAAFKRLGEIEHDECYARTPPLSLGGDYSAKALQRANLLEHLSLLARVRLGESMNPQLALRARLPRSNMPPPEEVRAWLETQGGEPLSLPYQGKGFERFLSIHAPGADCRPVPAVILKLNERVLPAELSDHWRQHGWCSYDSGLFWTIDPEELRDPLAEWLGADAATCHAFARSAWGDVFFLQEEKVYQIDANMGTVEQVSPSLDAFFYYHLCTDYFLDDVLRRKDFKKAQKQLGALEADECYFYELALVLGGSRKTTPITRGKLREQLSILAQLHGGCITGDFFSRPRM